MLFTNIKFGIPVLLIFFSISCSVKQEPLELFNPEAFVYNLNEGYELIATARVRGFTQKEVEETYHLRLDYQVHVVTPLSDTLGNLDFGELEEFNNGMAEDKEIEVQIYFGGEFQPGNYTIIFRVKDMHSNREAEIAKNFLIESD